MSEVFAVNSNISHHRILQKLGAGEMGEVYPAQDAQLKRKVALKRLTEKIAKDKNRMRRFEQ